MKVERIEIDSRLLGGSVLEIGDFNAGADFDAFERAYKAEFDPIYVTCRIPLEHLGGIHALEGAGFNLVECQIRSEVKLRRTYDVSGLNYDFVQVTREEDLGEVLEIASQTFVHDRFSLDPCIVSGFSGVRYREYVRKSFASPDEAVYRLIERGTGRVVAFKTHRYVGGDEVLFLLGGVHSDLKNVGLGPVNEFFEFNELMRKGIRRGITHISAGNYPVFNLEISRLGFRVLCTFAILRKIYPRTM